jgi:hypothetical protein
MMQSHMQVSEVIADNTVKARISNLGHGPEAFISPPISSAGFRHAIGSDSQVGHHISGQGTVPSPTLAQASTSLGQFFSTCVFNVSWINKVGLYQRNPPLSTRHTCSCSDRELPALSPGLASVPPLSTRDAPGQPLRSEDSSPARIHYLHLRLC